MKKAYVGYEINGVEIPGTTTPVSRFGNKDALMWWHWKQGKDGKDFRETRDKASDIGTCIHSMIEEDWRGKVFDRTDYNEDTLRKADHGFKGYLAWKEQTNMKVTHSELRLISEKYRFGGTIDCALSGGKRYLGDWKTAKDVYDDHKIQVGGGYSLLWEEHFPDQPLDGFMIMRFSKPEHDDDPVSFAAHFWDKAAFPILQEQFLLFLKAYGNDKRIRSL